MAPIWRFQGYTQPSITELLAGLSLSAPQREALLGATHCQAAGCTMTPPLDQVEAIAPVERARIYIAILAEPENLLALPLVSRRLTDPALWSDPRFSPEMAAIIRDSSFHYGGGWMFADSSSLCARVHSDSERVNVVRALLSTPSWLLSLDVQPGDDVEALARYWARGPRHKDVRQFLTSFSRAPGGTTVDVVHLLPVFPRAHLNTFDALDGPQHDCHWSAMNFFEPVADDRFSDSAAVVRELETRYHAVPVDQMLLGDVVLFARADDRSYVHSAVYVAADLLFSKNGRSPRAPWVLATLDELKQRYFLGQNIHAMRRNDLE